MAARLLLVMLLAFSAFAPAASAATFGPSTSFAVDTLPNPLPRGLEVADFNGDADPDLAVVNENSNNVSILLGLPGGGAAGGRFSAPTTTKVCGAPTALAVGQLDGDTDPDLAVVNETCDSVSVLLGGTGGSFNASASVATGSLPDAVAVGKFDSGSNPDLVVTNQGWDDLSVLLGDGGGGFVGPPTTAINDADPPPPAAGGITAADTTITVDDTSSFATGGLIRISSELIRCTGKTATTFFGCIRGSNGTAAAPHPDNEVVTEIRQLVGRQPAGVAVGRFNGDTDDDIVVANEYAGTVSVLLGAAGETFTGRRDYPVGFWPQSIAVDDFDGDGNSDLVVVNQHPHVATGGSLSLLFGTGGGDFTGPTQIALGTTHPLSVVVGDFNRDSDPDLAVANEVESNSTVPGPVSVLLGSAGGTFTAPANFTAGVRSQGVVIGDFNGDSDPDLAVANEGSPDGTTPGSVSILLGTRPEITSLFGPGNTTKNTDPTLTFSSNDPHATFQCRLDVGSSTGSWTPCNDPSKSKSYASLPDGSYTFRVRASDDGGHTFSAEATWSFPVDTNPPSDPTITDTNPSTTDVSPSNDNNPLVTGTAEAQSRVALYTTSCSGTPVASGTAAADGSFGIPVTVLDNSITTFYAKATDKAGNPSGCSTTSVIYYEVSPPPPPDPGPPPGGGPPGPGGPPSGGNPPAGSPIKVDVIGPWMAVTGRAVKLQASGAVLLAVSCPASEPGGCTGSLSLETVVQVRAGKRKIKLGKSSFRIGGGKNAPVKVRLSKKNRALVKKLRKVRVLVVINARDQVGNATTSKKILTLKTR